MNQRLMAAIGAALLLIPITAVRAADDAMSIVDKAIEARGGAEKLGKANAEQWKAKGTIVMMDKKMPYTADYFFQRPNMLRFDIALDFGGTKFAFSSGTDGKAAWEKLGDQAQEMEGKDLQAFLHNAYTMSLTQLLPLKEKDCTLTVADEIKINDKPAVGVKVAKKGHADVTLWFDKSSSLLVKNATTTWDKFSMAEVKQDVFISEYEKKDGNLYFKKLLIKHNGKDFIEEEFSDQKTVEKLDPKLFAKP